MRSNSFPDLEGGAGGNGMKALHRHRRNAADSTPGAVVTAQPNFTDA